MVTADSGAYEGANDRVQWRRRRVEALHRLRSEGLPMDAALRVVYGGEKR